jgi:hypothetical protein
VSGAIPPLPQYSFMTWCSVTKMHRDNSTFKYDISSTRFAGLKVHVAGKRALWELPKFLVFT